MKKFKFSKASRSKERPTHELVAVVINHMLEMPQTCPEAMWKLVDQLEFQVKINFREESTLQKLFEQKGITKGNELEPLLPLYDELMLESINT